MSWDTTVFLAHASEDKKRVRELYKKLTEGGLKPWLDEEDLMPGVHFENKIKEAIKKSRFFLGCISENSVSKNGFVQKELRLALNELEQKAPDTIYFIPVLLDDVDLPDITVGTISLRDYHASKIFSKDGLLKLIRYLQAKANLKLETKKKINLNFQNLRQLISKGQTETVLRRLVEYVKDRNDELQKDVQLISSRFNRLSKENISGLISRDSYTIENNQIVNSILETIKILEEQEKQAAIHNSMLRKKEAEEKGITPYIKDAKAYGNLLNDASHYKTIHRKLPKEAMLPAEDHAPFLEKLTAIYSSLNKKKRSLFDNSSKRNSIKNYVGTEKMEQWFTENVKQP